VRWIHSKGNDGGLHGGGENISYEKGRALAEHDSVLKAAFTGSHG